MEITWSRKFCVTAVIFLILIISTNASTFDYFKDDQLNTYTFNGDGISIHSRTTYYNQYNKSFDRVSIIQIKTDALYDNVSVVSIKVNGVESPYEFVDADTPNYTRINAILPNQFQTNDTILIDSQLSFSGAKLGCERNILWMEGLLDEHKISCYPFQEMAFELNQHRISKMGPIKENNITTYVSKYGSKRICNEFGTDEEYSTEPTNSTIMYSCVPLKSQIIDDKLESYFFMQPKKIQTIAGERIRYCGYDVPNNSCAFLDTYIIFTVNALQKNLFYLILITTVIFVFFALKNEITNMIAFIGVGATAYISSSIFHRPQQISLIDVTFFGGVAIVFLIILARPAIKKILGYWIWAKWRIFYKFFKRI